MGAFSFRTQAAWSWSALQVVVHVVAAGCGDTVHSRRAHTESDSAGITIVANDLNGFDQVCRVGATPAAVIGSADGGPEYELYRVFGASVLSDGRIVLVNQGSQELRFYDAAGRHLMSSGRKGGGPGEFSDAFHVWVLPGDTVWVGDYRPWQFLVFAPDGKWNRTVRPVPLYPNVPGVIEVLDGGRSILATQPFTSEGENWGVRHLTVLLHGSEGTVSDTIGIYPNGRWGMLPEHPRLGLYPLFESFFRIDATGTTVIMGHGSEPQFAVYGASGDLTMQRIIRWTVASRTVRAEHIAAEHQRIVDRYRDTDPAMARQMVDPLISDKRPVAERFPAFSSLRAGRDGRFWVREFVAPTATQEQQWLVFDAEGRLTCRSRLPAAAEALEFGADYLLTLERDDLDIERVVKYPLFPPATSADGKRS
jgi:hypothetical protein